MTFRAYKLFVEDPDHDLEHARLTIIISLPIGFKIIAYLLPLSKL